MQSLRLEVPDMDLALSELVEQIPRGGAATYGGLAAVLGDPVAARWVATRLLAHRHDADCRCHCVVLAGGIVGKYVSGETRNREKVARLEAEGAAVVGGRIDLDAHRFELPRSAKAAPLARLREMQAAWAEKFSSEGHADAPRSIAGLDVSYIGATRAVATYAVVEPGSLDLVWSVSIEREVRFPYISTYLAFRELPMLWDLVDAARAAGRLADIHLVDGSGVLHQRRGGVATCFGVSTGLTTIGVTKSLLFGRADRSRLSAGEWTYVRDVDGSPQGAALKTTPRGKKPIYVSPGYRIDVDAAVRIVEQSLAGHKLPEPLYWADRLSRKDARRAASRRAESRSRS
jgi:deoxyribonuclease V